LGGVEVGFEVGFDLALNPINKPKTPYEVGKVGFISNKVQETANKQVGGGCPPTFGDGEVGCEAG
jgi:hypothetical protein